MTVAAYYSKFLANQQNRYKYMQLIHHIAGYKFIDLPDIDSLQISILSQCKNLGIVGTILLSYEGININLAANASAIDHFIAFMREDSRFSDVTFHETTCESPPYKRLKVKCKKEIISFRQPQLGKLTSRSPAMSPQQLQNWLDEGKDFTLLDTRNDYEIAYGSFKNATYLHLNDFCEFPQKIHDIPKGKPVVMFCTGGIRCEKAAQLLETQMSNAEVYQLDGGILGYLAQTNGKYYEGDCFVFDERIAVNKNLSPINYSPISQTEKSIKS